MFRTKPWEMSVRKLVLMGVASLASASAQSVDDFALTVYETRPSIIPMEGEPNWPDEQHFWLDYWTMLVILTTSMIWILGIYIYNEMKNKYSSGPTLIEVAPRAPPRDNI